MKRDPERKAKVGGCGKRGVCARESRGRIRWEKRKCQAEILYGRRLRIQYFHRHTIRARHSGFPSDRGGRETTPLKALYHHFHKPLHSFRYWQQVPSYTGPKIYDSFYSFTA